MAKRIFQKIFLCPSKWKRYFGVPVNESNRAFSFSTSNDQSDSSYGRQEVRNKSPQNYAFCHRDPKTKNIRCTTMRFSMHIWRKTFFPAVLSIFLALPGFWLPIAWPTNPLRRPNPLLGAKVTNLCGLRAWRDLIQARKWNCMPLADLHMSQVGGWGWTK